jgi:hypothetical protein
MRRTIAALIIGFALGGAATGLAAPTVWRYFTIPSNGNTNITFLGNTKYGCAYHASGKWLICPLTRFSPASSDVVAVTLRPGGVSLYTGAGGLTRPSYFYPWAR